MEPKDGTGSQKDTSQNADTSGGKQETSKDPVTFTSEQVAASNKKAAEDALSAAGRTAKAFEQREAAVKASEQKAAAEVLVRREAELKAIPIDDAQGLTDLRARHRAEDTISRLAKLESELEEERARGKQRDTEAVQTTQESSTRALAASLNVDPNTLLTLSKLTDGSKEAIEAMANGLPKTGEAKPVILSDSGKTGGGGTLTVEQVKNMSPQEQMDRAAEIANLPLGLGE